MIDFGRFQTNNKKFQEMLLQIPSLASTGQNILISGEIGTGRRNMAEYIHECSTYKTEKLTRYKKDNQLSQFVLIEDIDMMTVSEHSILLQQLENQNNTIWIATTQNGFYSEVEKGLIPREYLKFFKIKIQMPTLQERGDDFAILIQNFLQTYSWIHGRVFRMNPDAIKFLSTCKLDRNIKELEEILEKAIVISKSATLQLSDLKDVDGSFRYAHQIVPLEEMERKLIFQTLELTGNNKTQASKLLGISIRTLRNKLSLYKQEGLYESNV